MVATKPIDFRNYAEPTIMRSARRIMRSEIGAKTAAGSWFPDSVAECIRRRNLMARILGVHRQREPPQGKQPVAALLR